MLEKSHLASSEISQLDVFSTGTVLKAISQMDNLYVNQLIVTDHNGTCIYDTTGSLFGRTLNNAEILTALEMNDVFTWTYQDGSMQSVCATPIVSYGALVGCVYMVENDDELGALIQKQQSNMLTTTLILELSLIIFSLIYSNTNTRRLQRVMASMRIIRGGDYSHRVRMGGNDELTHLADEFNDLVERLNTSEQKRQNFVSDASHELKTPLASIKLLSDSILQNEMDTDTIREFVGDIGNEADRLNRMSQKLLSLSRIESQADGDCEIVFIAPTVERALRMLSATAANNNVTIETDFSGDASILIIEDDLYQIIFNLLENGIKYNRTGGKLCVSLQRNNENAILTVKDSGVGIPEDAISHIFERFYRVDKARSRKTGGAGLGLSIVRNLIERNSGSISVCSIVGEGTTFTVTFPVFDLEDENEVDQLEC